MYVCLCNGYRDDEIREVAESGVRCAQEVYLTLGNGPCCGTCLDCAQDIVNDVHALKDAGNGNKNGDPAGQPLSAAGEAVLMAAE